MSLKNLLVGLFVILCVNACQQADCGINKKHFLANLENFVEHIQEEDLSYSDNKWVRYDARLNKMKDECYPKHEDDMTSEEKQEFLANVTKYYWLRYGSGFVNQILDEDSEVIDNIMESFRDAWNETEYNIEDFIENIQIELDDINTDDLESLFDEIGDDIEEWGEKLEEILDDKERTNRKPRK